MNRWWVSGCGVGTTPLIALLAGSTLIVMTAGSAQAKRPDTRMMTCQAARALIQQQGAVVMTTGRFTFDRIVSGRGFCDRGEETVLKVVPTSDNPRCRIGYTCRDRLIEPILRFPRLRD